METLIWPMKRGYLKFDAGAGERAGGVDGDCQVRALSTARGISYAAAWGLLYEIQGEQRECGFSLVRCLKEEDGRFGIVRKLSFPAVRGKPRMTGYDFCHLHPDGRFILNMANHVAAVVDGQLHDTWDSSDRCVYTAWEICEP